MDQPWGQLFVFFLWELGTFFLLAFNFRSLAKGNYFWTIASDGVIALNGMAAIKLMNEDPRARSWWAIVGSTVGGMVGSAAGIFVTKRLLGS